MASRLGLARPYGLAYGDPYYYLHVTKFDKALSELVIQATRHEWLLKLHSSPSMTTYSSTRIEHHTFDSTSDLFLNKQSQRETIHVQFPFQNTDPSMSATE